MTEKRGRGRVPGKNKWPLDASPFSSPLRGDVVRSTLGGEMREVISNTGGVVEYCAGASDVVQVIEEKSWREWCARERAEVVETEVKR